MDDSDRQLPAAESADSAASDPTPADSRSPFAGDKFIFKRSDDAGKFQVLNEAGAPVLFVDQLTHGVRNALRMIAVLGLLNLGVAVGLNISKRMGQPHGIYVFLGCIFLGLVMGLFAAALLRPRRIVDVFRNQSRDEQLLAVFHDKKVESKAHSYILVDTSKGMIGSFRLHGASNLLRRTWQVLDPQGDVHVEAVAMEGSPIKSIVRHFLPLVVRFRLGMDFILCRPGESQPLGAFRRQHSFRDGFVLDLTDDPDRTFDRRLAVATGVMLALFQHH